jgi:hypothetical protein
LGEGLDGARFVGQFEGDGGETDGLAEEPGYSLDALWDYISVSRRLKMFCCGHV